HNSLFLIAHFHNVIIGGVVFAMFAGIIFYWPKMFGWRLNETWGKLAFWFWFFGFYFAFMPLYILGFMGMTRRLNTFRSEEHTSELQSRENLVCRLLLEKKKTYTL